MWWRHLSLSKKEMKNITFSIISYPNLSINHLSSLLFLCFIVLSKTVHCCCKFPWISTRLLIKTHTHTHLDTTVYTYLWRTLLFHRSLFPLTKSMKTIPVLQTRCPIVTSYLVFRDIHIELINVKPASLDDQLICPFHPNSLRRLVTDKRSIMY
mgnify:CR=1 FL=1